MKERVELYLHSHNTPSWHGSAEVKPQGLFNLLYSLHPRECLYVYYSLLQLLPSATISTSVTFTYQKCFENNPPLRKVSKLTQDKRINTKCFVCASVPYSSTATKIHKLTTTKLNTKQTFRVVVMLLLQLLQKICEVVTSRSCFKGYVCTAAIEVLFIVGN
jgi:hypothetical protein